MSLNVEDVLFTEGGVKLTLKRSKTDPEAAGRTITRARSRAASFGHGRGEMP